MARFRKDLVTEGEFWVTDPDTGERHKVTLTRDRFNKWLSSYRRLREKGYNIPAPFDHNVKDAVPVRFGRDGAPKALENAGFIEELSQEIRDAGDGKSVAVLVAEIDVPGDANDPQSLAYKVGKTVKDTSVYVRPGFLDGTGELHEEGFMHAALCVHPIQPGQANFQSISSEKGGLAIAMSQKIVMSQQPGGLAAQFENEPDDDELREQGGTIGDPSGADNGDIARRVVEALREAKVMDLPDDTTEQTILNYILVAVRQKKLLPGNGGFTPPGQQQPPAQPAGANPAAATPGLEPPGPGGASGQQSPQAADPNQNQGQQPQAQGQGYQPSNPVNLKKPPKAGVEQPPSIAMSQTPEQQNAILMSQVSNLEASNKLLASYVTSLEADKRAARINALVASGRVTQKYADETLKPKLQAFTMSLGADGKPAKNPIDEVLEMLEQQPARTGSVINTAHNIDLSSVPAEAHAAILMSMGINPAGGTEQQHPLATFFAAPGAPATQEEAIATADQFLKNCREG